MEKKLYGIFLFVYFISSFCYAGAWVQKPGEGLTILTIQRYLSNSFWAPGGQLSGSPTYAKNEIASYTEFGLTKKFTIGFYMTGLESHTHAAGTNGGLNDALLLGRYLLWSKGSNVISIQLAVDRLGRAATFNIPPSNSSFNSGEAILAGTSGQFGKSDRFWFLDASFGLIQRYSAGNQLQLNLEAGYKFSHDHAWLLLQEYNTYSINQFGHPRGVNYNLFTIAPSLILWLKKPFGLQLGMTQDLFGQNVGRGTSVFAATWILI
jgi:hypothetical protein